MPNPVRASCSGGVFLSSFNLWNRFNIARHASSLQDSLGKPHRPTQHPCKGSLCIPMKLHTPLWGLQAALLGCVQCMQVWAEFYAL